MECPSPATRSLAFSSSAEVGRAAVSSSSLATGAGIRSASSVVERSEAAFTPSRCTRLGFAGSRFGCRLIPRTVPGSGDLTPAHRRALRGGGGALDHSPAPPPPTELGFRPPRDILFPPPRPQPGRGG